ncbi:hypothetical protein RCZ01_05470 [Capnocytophaga felis]|uniref:Uncharacterized protein n=2 Tax=Capnocytophaga felis TaxID=2267611 RepID=A0A5M4B7J0_9FLAO|nr:hypothetical protein RCZ01_05470 [Capnocytophaga felis]GET47592.1 hypothetical protein RCZ02_04230 [Capnocytophaga felis]
MAFAIISVGVYAQGAPANKAVKGTAPTQNVTCTDNAQNPIVGKRYTYTINGPEGKYHFFATDNGTFIDNGALATSGAYTEGNGQINVGAGSYNNANSEEKSIDITWTNAAASTSYLVVNHSPKTGCTTTNNLKVLKIQPKNAFFIELRNMDKDKQTQALSTTSNVDVCLGQIKSAVLTGDQIAYDYGQQSLFYEFIAVNYDKTFTPQIKIEGLQEGQTATLKWGYSKENISTELSNTITHTGNTITLPQITAEETATPSEGVSIYLELAIKNGKVEGTNDQQITLSADATTSSNIKDVKTDCTEEDEFADKAIQTLKARATITGNGLNFMPSQP